MIGPPKLKPNWLRLKVGFWKGTVMPVLPTMSGLEEAGRVQVGVADELVQRRVEVVGAAQRGHVDGGAGGAAVLGALVVGDHLELRDGVGRDGDDLVVEALVALAVSVVVDAVEQEVVEHAALAVDVVRARAHQAS